MAVQQTQIKQIQGKEKTFLLNANELEHLIFYFIDGNLS